MKRTTKWNIIISALLFLLLSGLFIAINENTILRHRLRETEDALTVALFEAAALRDTTSVEPATHE